MHLIISDHATLKWDGVIFLRVLDAFQASYGVGDLNFAIFQLVHTKMRQDFSQEIVSFAKNLLIFSSEIGKLSLDRILSEKELINAAIVEFINNAASSWGITCLKFEIREQYSERDSNILRWICLSLGDIKLPSRVQEAMQEQLVAERRKRAAILKSEGVRAADINVAEGKRQAKILASEAEKQERIDRANAEAAANLTLTHAKAKGLKVLAESLISEVNFINYRNAARWMGF
jgi:regulator of protease activity HflC (stomatin/prohibitin superfamily)